MSVREASGTENQNPTARTLASPATHEVHTDSLVCRNIAFGFGALCWGATQSSRRQSSPTITREFLEVPDPEDPNFTIEIDNPDFDQEVPNVGQIPGIAAFIGEAGPPDLRFSDPESPVFIDNGLYAVDGPEPGRRLGL